MVRTTEIPSGLKGTVYLNWYDPKDLTADDGVSIVDDPTESWSAENAEAGKVQDNRVSPSFLGETEMLVFSDDPNYTTTNVRKAIISIPGESFGDNLIVAVHPNPGIQNTFTFAEDNQTLQYETAPDGTKSNLGVRYRTSTLHAAAWNGLKVPSAWEYDEQEYTIETHAPSGFYDETTGKYYPADRANPQGDPAHATEEGPDASSVLKCGKGFDITLNYYFDHDRGGDFGYVHAVKDLEPDGNGAYDCTLLQKLSFVGNSGVKFGGKEVQILDVKAMVKMVDGDPPELLSSWANSVFSTGIDDNAKVTVGDYTPENLGCLLSGVVYGDRTSLTAWPEVADYANAAEDADGDPEPHAPRERLFNALKNNYNRTNGSLTIEVTPHTAFTQVDVYLDGTESFSDSALALASINKVTVQGHWGSGIVFTYAALTPKGYFEQFSGE
jgi:hypothetical protein